MKMTAQDLYNRKIIDEIIEEPIGELTGIEKVR